jgi:putative ABC transport system permease protein
VARIPLAWRQLTHESRRLAAAIAGIAFAVILMLMQLGLRGVLLDAAILHYAQLDCDLVMLNPQYEYLVAAKNFSWTRLYQALAVEDVASVVPIYMTMVPWKDPATMEETTLLMLGFDPRTRAFTAPGVLENLDKLEEPDTVLFDVNSHIERFGTTRAYIRENKPIVTELNGRSVRVAGVFQLGIGFGSLGNVVTSDQNFLRIVPYRDQTMIDIGLIRLKPGASPERVRAQLEAFLPNDVRVLTRADFITLERAFWAKVTPIGIIFGIGAAMGIIVGAIIVYQILYTDVSDHLSEYATLKAIGYTQGYLYRVVLGQALILSVLGYVPGFIVSWLLYIQTARLSGLPLVMTFQLASVVLVFTVVMCGLSAALAMRRVQAADPAEVF